MLAHGLPLVGDDEASDGEEGDCAKGGTGGSLGVVGALSACVALKEPYFEVFWSFFAMLLYISEVGQLVVPAIGPFHLFDFFGADPDLVFDHNVEVGPIVATFFPIFDDVGDDVSRVKVGDVRGEVDVLVCHPELQPCG